MKYIAFKLNKVSTGQAMIEYALLFAALVALTLFTIPFLRQIRTAAEGERDNRIEAILK